MASNLRRDVISSSALLLITSNTTVALLPKKSTLMFKISFTLLNIFSKTNYYSPSRHRWRSRSHHTTLDTLASQSLMAAISRHTNHFSEFIVHSAAEHLCQLNLHYQQLQRNSLSIILG